MNVRFYFKHMASSEALQSYTLGRLAALENLLTDSGQLSVTFKLAGDHRSVQFTCHARNRRPVTVMSDTDNMYGSVDLAVHKLRRVLRKSKEKMSARRSTALKVLAPEMFSAGPEEGTPEENTFPEETFA